MIHNRHNKSVDSIETIQSKIQSNPSNHQNGKPMELKLESNCCSENFLKVFCDFGYYTFLVPFRFKGNPQIGWKIHKSLFQKVFCGFAHTLVLYQYVTEVRGFSYNDLRDDPTEYFKWFGRVSSVIYKSVLIRTLWLWQPRFLSVIKFISETKELSINLSKIQSKFVISLICLMYILIPLIWHLLGFGIIHTPGNWSLSWFFRRCVVIGRFNFFLSNERISLQTNYTIAPEMNAISGVDITLAIITFFCLLARHLFSYSSNAFILMTCLTLWVHSNGLKKLIQHKIKEKKMNLAKGIDNFNEDDESVLKSYFALRKLSSLINDAMSTTVFYFILEVVVFYSISLNLLFIAPTRLRQLRALAFYVNVFVILIVAGEICKEVEEVHNWLSLPEISKSIGEDQLFLLVSEITNHYVGLSASWFVLDYTAILNMVGMLVTFFVICAKSSTQSTE